MERPSFLSCQNCCFTSYSLGVTDPTEASATFTLCPHHIAEWRRMPHLPNPSTILSTYPEPSMKRPRLSSSKPIKQEILSMEKPLSSTPSITAPAPVISQTPSFTSTSTFLPNSRHVSKSKPRRPPTWSPQGCLDFYIKVKKRCLDPDYPVSLSNAIQYATNSRCSSNNQGFKIKRNIAELMILDHETFTRTKQNMDRERMDQTHCLYEVSLQSLSDECHKILSTPEMMRKRQIAVEDGFIFGKFVLKDT